MLFTDFLPITFTSCLHPEQAQQNVGPVLDPNCLTLMIFLKDIFEKDKLFRCHGIVNKMLLYRY